MPQTNVMTVKMMFRVAVDPTDADSVAAAGRAAQAVLAHAREVGVEAKITQSRFQTIRPRGGEAPQSAAAAVEDGAAKETESGPNDKAAPQGVEPDAEDTAAGSCPQPSGAAAAEPVAADTAPDPDVPPAEAPPFAHARV